MILAVSFSGSTDNTIGSLTVTTDSRVFTLTDDQPDFQKVLNLLKDGKNDEAEVMLDRLTHVRAAVENSKFSINGNVVSFAGRNLPAVMAEYVIRMKNEGFDLTPLERFTENLYENPSFRAINEAFLFITANKMPITEDGCFIGYRAVTSDYKDIRTRTFDNSIGAVCEEPRNLVDENPDITCSNGLHVCSLAYINGAGAGYGHSDSPWIIVKVNPRDVVAVPRDYNNTKLRCCRFEVVGELDRSKIAPEDKKSYREESAVFKETDAELRAAGKFYELGEKHRKNNDARGSGQPLTNDTFGDDENGNYYNYLDGYYGRARGHSIPTKAVAPAVAVTSGTATFGSNADRARIMFNEGRFTDLMNFKKEKRVSFQRLGFTTSEAAWIETNRNQNGTPAKPVYTDQLGYEVGEPLVFDKHGYDQFGYRRSGYNRKGHHRGGYASNQATPSAHNNVNAPKPAVPPAAAVTEFTTIASDNVLRQTLDIVCDYFSTDRCDVYDHLVTDLGADSLDAIELMMMIEEEFGIDISDEEAENQKDLTVKGIAEFIESKLNVNKSPQPVAITPVTVVTQKAPVSDKYAQGAADGAVATSFQPKQVGPEYWNGFTEAWKTNPNNQNR